MPLFVGFGPGDETADCPCPSPRNTHTTPRPPSPLGSRPAHVIHDQRRSTCAAPSWFLAVLVVSPPNPKRASGLHQCYSILAGPFLSFPCPCRDMIAVGLVSSRPGGQLPRMRWDGTRGGGGRGACFLSLSLSSSAARCRTLPFSSRPFLRRSSRTRGAERPPALLSTSDRTPKIARVKTGQSREQGQTESSLLESATRRPRRGARQARHGHSLGECLMLLSRAFVFPGISNPPAPLQARPSDMWPRDRLS